MHSGEKLEPAAELFSDPKQHHHEAGTAPTTTPTPATAAAQPAPAVPDADSKSPADGELGEVLLARRAAEEAELAAKQQAEQMQLQLAASVRARLLSRFKARNRRETAPFYDLVSRCTSCSWWWRWLASRRNWRNSRTTQPVAM